jgi:peptidoglycan/LPS O-acetylase OafA/YrhL
MATSLAARRQPSTSDAKSRQPELVHNAQLDSVRWWLFIPVFLDHALNAAATCPPVAVLAQNALWVFFVISGFLITRIILKSETGDIQSDLKTFYIRRALRIFPLYYTVLLGLTFFAHLEYPAWYYFYAYNFRVFIFGHWTDFASHFWSLCVEEQFYLLFPPLLLLCHQTRRVKLIGGLIFFGFITQMYFQFFFPTIKSYVLLPICGQCILWGCLAGYYELKVPRNVNLDRLMYTGLVVQCIVCAIESATHCKTLLFLSAPCIAAYIIGLWRTQNKVILSVLGNKATAYLGRISYGLYVFHLPVLWFAPSVVHHYCMPWSFAVTLLLAVLSWHFFESPINNLKRKIPYRSSAEKKVPIQV